MATLPWTPWHQVVRLRDDLRSGQLPLAIFAADLYDVAMGTAQPVYQDPREFFALTYPTVNLRELARDVVLQLAGKSEKAVRQLELTYGGGKTHTLIALYHLVGDPKKLPTNLPAVQEFIQHIGTRPPQARIAVLAFDKLDVEKGMQIRGPDGKQNGEMRWLRQPWSVLAYQLAGSNGLRLLHPDNRDEERESAPAENLLVELLKMPAKQGLATLILIDEVLMYAREKVGLDREWLSRLANFFQYLTQAATKVPTAAIVASLLATDPRKNDELGRQITAELHAIFQREQESGVLPVMKEDAAEVLRRRFFTPDSIRDRAAFRPHVVAAVQGIAALDEQTAKDRQGVEARVLQSYPFYPDLTDIFYTKWTNLDGFQRTRGVLRTFALALRDAERWDDSPLVGANVFLGAPGAAGLSDAAREVATVAATEEYEGKRHDWKGILEGELAKAREIEQELSGLRHREVEQAIFATFLHSQPIGQKASTRDLLLLLGPTRPDKIELEKALRRWTEISWFLDEGMLGEIDGQEGGRQLPKFWRLGSRPNLRQMHHDACTRIGGELVDARLLEEITRVGSLKAGASAAGAKVHMLPQWPRDIEDDGEFHFAILGPKAVSDAGRPSAEARRFLEEKTGPDGPRVYRNALVLVTPSRDGLEAARTAVRDYLGWDEVRSQLKSQEVDPIRAQTLAANVAGSQKKIAEMIKQAYSIVVTMSKKGEPEAFKVTLSGDSLFNVVKADSNARIQETAITAEALLPEGPYDLWRAGEPTRRVKDLVGAFAQYPKLPKMLNRKAILDTLIDGCRAGAFVLQLPRPDRSMRTFWREAIDDDTLKDPALEAILPARAQLASLSPQLLTPNTLPGLWTGPELQAGQVFDYFAGGRVVQVPRGGYDEAVVIPQVARPVVEEAIRSAVKAGHLWLTAGPTSLCEEDIPEGVLTNAAILQAPPQSIPATAVLPQNLPAAWTDGITTARAIADALSTQAGKPLPWSTVRQALDGAFAARFLERTLDSADWPCDYTGSQLVHMSMPVSSSSAKTPLPGPASQPQVPVRAGVLTAEADLSTNEIQNLADVVGRLTLASVGHELTFHLRVELGGANPAPPEGAERINQILQEVSPRLRIDIGTAVKR